MKKIFFLILFFISSSLFAKGYYIVTLHSGTKIKADSVIKLDGYIKVFKFGGYIIYPAKNVKSIKYVNNTNITAKKEKVLQTDEKKCSLVIENFKADPYLNGKKGIFNVEVKGEIINNCEDTFKNIKLHIKFMDKNKQLIKEKQLFFDEILPLSTKKFHKVFNDIVADNISYFLYKLEYLREK